MPNHTPKPIHEMILSNPAMPPMARRLHAAVFADAPVPENVVKVSSELLVDCTSGWVCGKDADGNLLIGRLTAFERASNPTLPTQSALKTWPV